MQIQQLPQPILDRDVRRGKMRAGGCKLRMCMMCARMRAHWWLMHALDCNFRSCDMGILYHPWYKTSHWSSVFLHMVPYPFKCTFHKSSHLHLLPLSQTSVLEIFVSSPCLRIAHLSKFHICELIYSFVSLFLSSFILCNRFRALPTH